MEIIIFRTRAVFPASTAATVAAAPTVTAVVDDEPIMEGLGIAVAIEINKANNVP